MADASTTLRVALFAGMAEAVGKRSLEIPWCGGTVAEMRRALATLEPRLEPLLTKSAVALGDRYALADEPVLAGTDVAIIPPVSGG